MSGLLGIFAHFNCTIQELKRQAIAIRKIALEFQLHHTGIKTPESEEHPPLAEEFQLHHTGIKTPESEEHPPLAEEFQLHHTGIKTSAKVISACFDGYFNCTIQELKRT